MSVMCVSAFFPWASQTRARALSHTHTHGVRWLILSAGIARRCSAKGLAQCSEAEAALYRTLAEPLNLDGASDEVGVDEGRGGTGRKEGERVAAAGGRGIEDRLDGGGAGSRWGTRESGENRGREEVEGGGVLGIEDGGGGGGDVERRRRALNAWRERRSA